MRLTETDCELPAVSDGVFTKDPLRTKLSYSVMLLVCSKMPSVSSVQLTQAVTIATRYSMVREQGLGHCDALKSETTITQYKHQHFRLLTLIAKSYAMYFASKVTHSTTGSKRCRLKLQLTIPCYLRFMPSQLGSNLTLPRRPSMALKTVAISAVVMGTWSPLAYRISSVRLQVVQRSRARTTFCGSRPADTCSSSLTISRMAGRSTSRCTISPTCKIPTNHVRHLESSSSIPKYNSTSTAIALIV
jgi:hypothetical protein